MLSLISYLSGVFRKADSDELTMELYLGIRHNRTIKKKGNPKSTQKAQR